MCWGLLIPAVAECDQLDAHRVGAILAKFKGHPMAKAASSGVLDAELRSRGVSLARELGAVRERVPCGVALASWSRSRNCWRGSLAISRTAMFASS